MNSNIKIVQVIREVHPFAGSSGVAYSLQQQFNALGVSNRTLAWRTAPRRKRHKYIEKSILLFDIVACTFWSSRQIYRLQEKEENLVVLVHNDSVGGDIYIDHGLHKAVVMNNKRMLLRNPLHWFMLAREEYRHWRRRYRTIVCLSSASRETMHRYFPSTRSVEIAIIPNGVDAEKFFPAGPKPERSGLRLIFVGHEFDRKGLQFVLEAVSRLPPEVSLTVIGGAKIDIDQYSSRADRLGIGGRVTFLGRRTDVADLMRECDVMVMPSRFEAWPLVALESMRCGLPVLMTVVGGTKEMIHDYQTGFVVTPDPQDIASRVGELLADRTLLLRMRENCIQFSAQYSWRSIAGRYVELCERVLKERG